MKAEKIHLTEYQCPSCGADLHYREDQFMITCQFCGARVERELDRTEHDKVAARKQLAIVRKYREDTLRLAQLQKARVSAKERVKLCSENSLTKPKLIERLPYIAFVIALPIAAFFIISGKGSASSMVMGALILMAAAAFSAVMSIRGKSKVRLAAEAKARIDTAQQELVRAGDELAAFERSFDKSVIPECYRSPELLDQLVHIFESYQACTLGEGFKLCDEYIAHKRMEDMKREQLARAMVMLTHSLKEERESTAVSTDGVPLMKRGSFAEIAMAKKRAQSGRDKGDDLMMAIAKAAAKPDKKN